MTSPASGAGSAPDLPDYAPATSNDRRWLVLVVVAAMTGSGCGER
jgi:hypothetical protein